MFVFESCVFVLFLGGCCLWSLVREELRARSESKRADEVTRLVSALAGKPITAIEEDFGPPYEVIEGHYGRSLYVWKTPPSAGLPKGHGVLVLTVTVLGDANVEHAVWRRQ